jgi:hypothetical protein
MANPLDATSRPYWFRLDRHDGEGETPPADPPADTGPDPADPPTDPDPAKPDPKPTDTVAYWKQRSRENEARAKANADKAKKLDDLEAANKTEAERLASAKDAADKRAAAATSRAVTAEVKALADGFADREDATALLGDLAKYADVDGEIDTEAIASDLADLLDRKPHLRKQTTAAPPAPPKPLKPDPGQGSGRGDDKPTDFRTADKAAVAAELAKYGIRSL